MAVGLPPPSSSLLALAQGFGLENCRLQEWKEAAQAGANYMDQEACSQTPAVTPLV